MKPEFDRETIEALTRYMRDLYAPEDDLLKEISAETERQDMPMISVRPEEGRMLQFLVAISGAKKVVEVGTLAGYSGVWLARALPEDGKLYALDVNPKHAEVAGTFFEKAGLSQRVEQRVGDGHALLDELSSEGPFDMLFLDAEKSGYPAYLEWGLANVRIGGLIVAHNAFSNGRLLSTEYDGDKDIEGLRAFNRAIAENDRLLGTIIPVGDGFAAAVVVR